MFKKQPKTEVDPTPVALSDESRQALADLTCEIHVASEILTDLLAQADAIGKAVGVELADVVRLPRALPEEPTRRRSTPTDLPDDERIRTTPYTRRPLAEQVAWLMAILADGEWHTGYEIAKVYATDEKHFRYLRSSLTNRLGDLYKQGLIDRADAETRGAMFKYRVKP